MSECLLLAGGDRDKFIIWEQLATQVVVVVGRAKLDRQILPL